VLIGLLLMLLLGAAFSRLLQLRIAAYLVDKVLVSQRVRVEHDVRHFDEALRRAEESLGRFSRLVSHRSGDLAAVPDDFSALVQRDGDGAWRSRRDRFDAQSQAGIWIPPSVPLTAEARRSFLRLQTLTTQFGQGAVDTLISNTWVLPLTNGEVIYWPGNPSFIYDAKANLDYRSTPWVRLTSPVRSRSSADLPRWTTPAYDPAAHRWLISVVAPYRVDGRWAGAVGHDIVLADLLRWLDGPAEWEESNFSRPLMVASLSGQLYASGDVPGHPGQQVSDRYRSLLVKAAELDRTVTLPHGQDYLVVAPLRTLGAQVVYRVDGQAVRREVEAGLQWLQIGQLAVVLLLVGAGGVILWGEARRRQEQELWLAKRNRELEGLVQQRTADLEALNLRLANLAAEDSLTGLGNRRQFDEALAMAWAQAARRGDCLSLLMVDVDHFKAYNDALGHPEGDRCLQVVAATLGATLRRAVDLVCRYGGEEFVVLLPGTDADGALLLAERLREAVLQRRLPHPGEGAGVVSISLGVAMAWPAPGHAGGAEALLADADGALYQAKQLGRNRSVVAPRSWSVLRESGPQPATPR